MSIKVKLTSNMLFAVLYMWDVFSVLSSWPSPPSLTGLLSTLISLPEGIGGEIDFFFFPFFAGIDFEGNIVRVVVS